MEPLETDFNWKSPNYAPVFAERARRLAHIRANPKELRALRHYYRANPADFISSWGVTVDPRVASADRSPVMPFLLFPKQREMIGWMIERWRANEPGIMEKSRDVGASFVSMALACTLCLFNEDLSIGFGSYVEDKVDRSGDPDCLFYKARMFLNYLPVEFLEGWELKKHSAHMRIQFPGTGSSITGEAGDNIGRGGRKSMVFIDESAHLERPLLIDAALSATTQCRIDMSSVYGTASPFAQKRHSGRYPVFTFHWRDDPRKDEAWYADMLARYDASVIAQEIDLDYSASVDNVIIPSLWVQAAVDAHVKLGIKPTGVMHSALDVADTGRDKNAWAARHGMLLTHCQQWSGVDSDIYETTKRAMHLCDEYAVPTMAYDGDGMGAACRGDARKINEARRAARRKAIAVEEYRGSAAVAFPEQRVRGVDGRPLDRKNEDYYLNKAAQDWFGLRFRFQQTFRAIKGLPYDPDDLISIDSTIPDRARLLMELSQPTYEANSAGKMKVAKAPDGAMSPNLADAVRMVYAIRRRPMVISDDVLAGI